MKSKPRSPLSASAAKWLLLTLAALTFGFFMSQRPSRKYPSPADPGMLLVKDMPIQTGPTIDHPTSQDPNSGDIPDPVNESPDTGNVKDNELDDVPVDPHHGKGGFEPNYPETKGPEIPTELSQWELIKVANGSDFGRGNDWVLVLKGRGFVECEAAPTVHIGKVAQLQDVFVNQGGTAMFAVLPNRVGLSLDTLLFTDIAVQNPGGLNRDPQRWARLAIDPNVFLAALKAAPSTRFKRGVYFLEEMK